MVKKPTYEEQEQRVKDLENEAVKRRAFEEKWLLFMESATDAFALYDSRLHLLEVNDALLQMLPEGKKKEDILGKHITEFAPDTNETNIYDRFREVIKTGNPITIFDFRPPAKWSRPGRHANITAFRVGDGLGVILTDIAELKHAETELRKREAELEIKNATLEEANIALKVLLKKRVLYRIE